jgi:hypothetical protein
MRYMMILICVSVAGLMSRLCRQSFYHWEC